MKKKNFRTSILASVVISVLATSSAMAAQKAPKQGPVPRVDSSDDNETYGRFIVTYRDGSTTKNNRTVIVKNMGTALTRAGLVKSKPTTAAYSRKLAVGSDLVKVSRKLDRAEADAFMRQIATDPAVVSVVPDRLRHAMRDVKAQAAVITPSDTYYAKYQWDLKAPDGTATQGGVANRGGTNVNSAWDLADGTGIVVAVLDTGITAHPDVDTSLAADGYDFIIDSFVSGRATDGRVPGGWDTGDWTTQEPWLSECTDASNPPEDSSWHGTHVASTAGAELTNNATGMAGIAYGAKILPVRVLGHCGGYDSDINDAIIWAAGGHVDGVPDNANPAQVINLSLGGAGACPATDPQAMAVAQANALGAVVVVSAGNSNADAAGYSPGQLPGCRSRWLPRASPASARSTPTTAPAWKSQRRVVACIRTTAAAVRRSMTASSGRR